MIKIAEIRFIDLFGGVGGFRLGLERCDRPTEQDSQKNKHIPNSSKRQKKQPDTFDCVAYYEIDKYACQTYNKNFKENHEPTDIRNIEERKIPKHDLICAGFPCQSFSIAGKRKGFEDTRGTLFFEICRIARFHRPKMLFLENVKGLLSHEKGETFRVILNSLQEMGYSVEWEVLNSKNFGVPQNRERVFIVGHLGGFSGRQIFPIGKGSEKTSEQQQGVPFPTIFSSQHKIARGMPMIADYRNDEGLRVRREPISPCLSRRRHSETDISTMAPLVIASRGRNPKNPSDRTTGCPTEQRLEPNSQGITNTLSSVQKDNLLLRQSRIRRLTPTECERLQGFPDGWTEGVSDTQRYKQMGNAVTVNVIEAIGKKIMKHNCNNG